MRALPGPAELPHSEWPALFEAATGWPLDLRPGYAEWLCSACEPRIWAAAAARTDLMRVASKWQEILMQTMCCEVPQLVKVEPTFVGDGDFDGDERRGMNSPVVEADCDDDDDASEEPTTPQKLDDRNENI